ncbi:MAG: hypothetical protein KTV68_07625 [Acidimicrobiia bacterium]|nr:hypothetical protein [Acidimicrobiia bacterium]MCY4434742.1 hypothetical protein [bacterium]
MEPKANEAMTLPDPGSPDYDYGEIDRKSELADAEMHEIIAQGLPVDDLTTFDDIKQRIARLNSSD